MCPALLFHRSVCIGWLEEYEERCLESRAFVWVLIINQRINGNVWEVGSDGFGVSEFAEKTVIYLYRVV